MGVMSYNELSRQSLINLLKNTVERKIELEQQIIELKESQKQKQIIRLCNRLDEAKQQKAELKELLDDAMGVLMNYEQSFNKEWISDYQKCCQRYEQIIT